MSEFISIKNLYVKILIVFGVGPMAHSLAHCANVLDEEVVWLEDSPPPARDVLYFDSSFLNE